MHARYTLKQANEALKLVRVIADEMLERRRERRGLAVRRDQLERANTPEGLRKELAELDARIWELDEALLRCKLELEELGLKILRPNPLTIHIPGCHDRAVAAVEDQERDEDELLFCWQEGEAEVSFGHPSGEDGLPRRPLRVARGA